MKYLLPLLFLLFLPSCDKKDGINSGTSTTTIRIVSLPGITPFPNGTTFEAYAKTGPYNNRSYELIENVQLSPTLDDPAILEGKFSYEGVHPVTIELFDTEKPQVNEPFGFSNPFNSQSIDFFAELGSNTYHVYYFPKFWVNLKVYTEKSGQELKGGIFRLGDGRTSLIIGTVFVRDRLFIGDTLETTGEGYLSTGTSAPLYLRGASVDFSDSLLVPLSYSNFIPNDTTFIFYNADDGTYSITH